MTQTQVQEDPLVARARARVGKVLQEKWKLDALLGVGGMAAVYSAVHRNGKRVAVKMLHPEFSNDQEVRKRFLQEGYAANTITHEGAVSVLDDDTTPEGDAFLVMELLEGETLEERWERSGRHLPVREVLSVVEQLLDVLAAAHAKNVVHRDIKPENLFLTKTGVLKVLDFGIAKVFERQTAQSKSTQVGMVMGTPAFMSPEQARARWDEVDGRTDLWAVGATMFTLLTGRHVHVAETNQDQLIMSATTQAASLVSVVPDAPQPLVQIVDGALAYERASRWPDARSMQDAVHALLEALGGPEVAAVSVRRPVTTGTTVATSVSRRSNPAAVTQIETAGGQSPIAAWTQEREMRFLEANKWRAQLAGVQQRYGVAKKRVADAQAKLEAGRKERASLEQWFKRQVGTRTAAVEEARKEARRQMAQIAMRAVGDTATFGAEYDPTREQIAKLQRASDSVQRDEQVHAAAIDAFDARAMRTGIVLLGVAAALLLALIIAPIVWRATRVVDAPEPVPVQAP